MEINAEEYKLEFFRANGFKRNKCKFCGAHFWSLTESDHCFEAPCIEYTFLDRSPFTKKLRLSEMRELYQYYFEKNGHTRVRRYPVVARWRDDVFFTQASIYDFQPWVINRTIEPPANPLVVAQPCVRFNDIDNVGKTGRHFTLFEMLGHHAFNTEEKFVYFKDRTVELCHNLLTRELGVKPEEISYKEEAWEGGGNSGPSLSVGVAGLELATLVFMMYVKDGDGWKKMDMEVVDTGYGLERYTWMSQATPSAYDAVFHLVPEHLIKLLDVKIEPSVMKEYSRVAGLMDIESAKDIKVLREKVAARVGVDVGSLEKQIAPFEHIYTLADHTRNIAFLISDNVIPSNMREGYFLRMLIRRCLRALRTLALDIPLSELVVLQIKEFGPDFPELMEMENEILNIVEIEAKRYAETVAKGKEVVGKFEKQKKVLGFEELAELYESHGLNPELVREFAKVPVEIPEDFYARLAEKHSAVETSGERMKLPENLPESALLIYTAPKLREFTAEIVYVGKDFVVLDKTYFYPEGGGQEYDTGWINGIPVVNVQKSGKSILHFVKSAEGFARGMVVRCEINWERRMQLAIHHTATHIINGAARRVLGKHVWQSGAHKSVEVSRLDITHYANLTREEVRKIEKIANEVVLANLKVNSMFMERTQAEQKYGFRLYQGGVVPGREIRIVEIPDFDVEACGGAHCESTGEVGLVKILRTRRIQDGVVRIEFVAGLRAYQVFAEMEEMVGNLAGSLKTTPENLVQAFTKFYEEANLLKRELERVKQERIVELVRMLESGARPVGSLKLIGYFEGESVQQLLELARKLTEKENVVVFLTTKDEKANFVLATSRNLHLNCGEIVKGLAGLGVAGGGKPTIAQGTLPWNSALAALAEIERLLG
ncbi:MAG: alanine--tRNA ligase [Thermoplasmata archaeon]|nr:alanine--tRNA ligase [Thermoplasmata archaeon]